MYLKREKKKNKSKVSFPPSIYVSVLPPSPRSFSLNSVH